MAESDARQDADIEMRPADQNDLQFLRACARAAYQQYIAVIGKPPAPMVEDFVARLADHFVHIASAGDEPIGYAVWTIRNDALFLDSIAILPAAQSGGRGRAMMAWLEGEARRRGLIAIELYTNEKMTRNLTFYAQLNYRETGRVEEHGFRRVYFRKALQ